MASPEHIKNQFERNVKVLNMKSNLGIGTAVTKVRLRDGLVCDIEEGPWKLVADMGEKSGGEDQGPNPGVYGRSALGSCLAIAYATWAAKMEVPINSLDIEIHADYNTRGAYGLDDVSPTYSQVRYVVNLETDAPEANVLAMMEAAEKNCAYLQIFAQPMDVQRELRLNEASAKE